MIDDELFSQVIVVRRPAALAEFLDEATALPLEHALRTIQDPNGGWFLRCWAALPFQVEWAPLQYGLWVKITPEQYADADRVYAGLLGQVRLEAPLAHDWPGFAGSSGARCTLAFRHRSEPVVVGCADAAIAAAGRRRDPRARHAELAELYARATV